MQNIDALTLLKKYQTGQCNQIEISLLERWCLSYKDDTFINSHALLNHLYRKQQQLVRCNLNHYLYTLLLTKVLTFAAHQHPEAECTSALQKFIIRTSVEQKLTMPSEKL